jgi:RHS repeat-associated protein
MISGNQRRKALVVCALPIARRLRSLLAGGLRAILIFFVLISAHAHAVQVRVVSYDTGEGFPTIGSSQFAAIKSTLARINGDVVAFQGLTPATVAAWQEMASQTGNIHTAIGEASDLLQEPQLVGVMSRFPILESEALSSPSPANELFCQPLRVVIDVPGAAKPLVVWNVRHRYGRWSGSNTPDATLQFSFSRSVEAIRVVQDINSYRLNYPFHREFVVLGNFNDDAGGPQPPSSGQWPPVSSLPFSYVLGSDIVPFNLAYSKFPDDRYSAAGGGLARLPALQQDGLSGVTLPAESRAVDYLLLSGDLFASAAGEIYNSVSDAATGGAGLPKAGSVLPAETSATAAPHFPVFADLQLEDEATPTFLLAPEEDFAATLLPGSDESLPAKIYRITNASSEPIDWQVEADQPWVSIDQSSGGLAPSTAVDVSLALNEQARALQPGKYSCLLTFTDQATGRYFVRTIRLVVQQPALLQVSPSSGINAFGDPGGPFAPSTVTYTLRNLGVEPLDWSLSIPVPWLSATANTGTLEPGGSATVGVSLTSAAESLSPALYVAEASFTNETNDLGNTTRSFRLGVGGRDYLTELFAPGSFDLVNRSVTFTPSGSTYRVCLGAASQFPTDPQGGTALSIPLDTYALVQLGSGARFPFFGTNYTSFHVAGHGHITFGGVSPPAEFERTLANHFNFRRISAFFADMDPSQRGTVSWKQLADRVAVTYQDVPEFSFASSNNFQVELFFDGRIRITYLNLGAIPRDILVGISPGGDVPEDFLNSKLSSYLPCSSAGTFIPASLRASDFLPAVPGTGMGTEIFNRIGGGAVPSPTLLVGREPDVAMRVPVIDFPRPGQTAAIGGSLDLFFADTIKPPVVASSLIAENFISRFQGFLKVDSSADVDPFTPGIQLSLGVGSNAGYYLLLGDLVLGSASDRDFAYSWHDLTFEAPGLYPLTVLYSRGPSGPSGVELSWSRGTPMVTEIVPQGRLYRSVTTANRAVSFDDLSEGVAPGQSYRNLGVDFITSPGVVATATVPDYVPVTAPFVLGNPGGSGSVSMAFVDPETGSPAVTDFVSFYVIDAAGAGAEVTAYDPAGQTIFSRSVQEGARSQTAVSFSHPYIARVEVAIGDGAQGGAIDQLAFKAPRTVKPVLNLSLGAEPVLEGGGLAGSVSLAEAWYENLVVSFTTSPVGRLGSFEPVVIPAGETSVSFTLPVARDGVQSPPINVLLTASVGGSDEVSASFTVLDVDRPDLTVQNARIEPSGQLLSGAQFTVLWSVANVGLYPVGGNFSDRVIVRNLSTGQILLNQLVPYDPSAVGNGAIGGGESRSRQLSLRLPDGPEGVGDLRIEITTDATNSVAEFAPGYDAEANNSAEVTANAVLAPYPDLQVASVTILPAAGLSGIQATGGVIVNWTVSNNGNGAVQSAFSDRLIVRNLTTGQVLFNRVVSYDPTQPGAGVIESGQSRSRTDEFVLPAGISAVGELEFEVITNAGASPVYEYNADGTATTNNSTSTTVTSTQERQGPSLSNIRFNSQPFTNGLPVTGSGVVSLSASDASGVGRIDFFVRRVDGGSESPLGSSTAPPYSVSWNAETTETDGLYAIIIRAYDTYGNLTESAQTLNLTLAVPPAPTITVPANNAVLSRGTVTVTGRTQAGRAVTVFVNGNADPATAPADASGNYVKPLSLADGTSMLGASVSNRAGASARTTVTVEVDRSVPSAPTAVTATAGAGGSVQLSWARPSGAIAGYHVYRSTTSAFESSSTVRITTSLLSATSFRDTPPDDGTYFYRIGAVNTAQTEGDPSVVVSAVSDRTAPTAALVYTSRGAFDAESGQFGTGPVDVSVTVSEPLAATPFLSLSPPGASPVVVDLRRVSDTVYSGTFVITSSIPTGRAVASMSARDAAGNRGTAITSGDGIFIDTQGPRVVSLDIQPARSVRNDPAAPVTVIFTARLDAPVKAGTVPKFSYKLSQSLTTPVVIADVAATSDPLVYTVAQQLPANAGSTPESLQLIFEAVDALDNKGTVIDAQSSFQVYQNELPGLESPVGLTAKGEPAGEILLDWNPVQGAARYQIFRRTAGIGEFLPVTATENTTYTDLPPVDGNYEYRVAAVREENGETSVGAPSNTATALSDRVPPAPPSNVRLSLVSRGVQVDWDHSPSFISEALTYSIYRTAPLPAEPQLAGAKIPGNRATDAAPSPDRPNYYLVAVDSVGNHSSATPWAYLNIDLLPVRTLEINQTDQAAPVVSWSQVSGNIAGYDIYWGPTNALTKLNTAGLLAAGATSFTDNSYTLGAGRNYTVVTVDNTGQESPGRSLELPRVSFSLPEGASVARGVMNRLTYTVRNDSTKTYESIQLRVKLAGREHYSELVDIEAGASGEVSVVVGGYSELTGETAALETALLYAPGIGEKVFLVRNSTVAVTSGQLLVDLAPGEFTSGGKGKVRFTVTNTSSEPIEFTTAEAGGSRDSSEARLSLLTADGSVLATKPLRISSGAQVVLLPSQRSVVRLEPGASYTSPELEIDVPPNAPARMVLRLEIDKIYYRQGQPEQVVLDGLQTRRDILSVQTSYTAQVDSVTPAESNGDVPVVIVGTATARVGGPMPNARFRLFIVRDGFESMREVFTDSAGRFSFDYVPAANEAGGVYEVRAVHPDITDRKAQTSFTIRRVTVSPMEANLRSVKNYVQPVSFTARTGRGVTVNGLRLEYLPQDQEGGVAVPGITVVPDAPVASVGPDQTARLGARLTASLDAPASGVLYLRVSSNESGAAGWQKIKLNYQFGPAAALLTPSPRTINTGANPGSGVAEELTITNNGLIAAENLQFALLQQDGRVAPSWASLIVGDSGPLEVGASQTVSLSFQPDASVPPGQYGFLLRVQSTDGARADVPISVAVTPAGEGNVEFRVVNPFSEYDANGGVRVGLAGASVQIQNEDVTSIERTLTTDELGGALFEKLPAGTYKYRVNASRHVTSSGRFWIRPGATTTQTVQVAYNPVSIEWSVVPVTIEDRYDVVLEASFETDVRVPVIVMDPPAINLPRMCRGDVVNGEFTITNKGLIRADDFQIPLPPSDGRIKVELQAEIPKSLGALETVRIPYRVTALQDLGGECASGEGEGQGGDDNGGGNSGGGGADGGGGDGSGGGGGSSGSRGPCIGSYPVPATFIYECDNGDIYPVYGYVYFFYTYWGDCGGSGGGSGWETVFGPQGGGGGGGGIGPPISPKPVPTVECWLLDVRLGRHEVTIDNLDDSHRTPSGCSVNTLTRQFEDDIVDLNVPIPGRPGEAVQVLRRYRGGEWRFFETIQFDPSERAGPYTELYWQSFRFLAEPDRLGETSRYRSGNHLIEVDESSSSARFRLSSRNSWAVFDAEGNLRSFGRNTETYATMVYSAAGKVSHVLAGTGPQILLTYNWDSAGRLDFAEDHSGRRVDYIWQSIFNGAINLHKVVAPDGAETFYSYEGFSKPQESGTTLPAARITQIRDATGKSHFIDYSGGLVVKSVLDEQGRGKFFEFTRDQTTGAVLGSVRSTSGRIDEKWFHEDGELYEWRVNGAVVRKIARDLRTRTWVTTDADGYQWTETRDENGRTIRVVNPDGSSRSYDYDPQTGRVVQLVNERGVRVVIEYDDRGNTTRIIEAVGTASERVVRMDFGDKDRIRSMQLPGSGTQPGARIDVSYNEMGDVQQISGPIPGSVNEVLQRDELGNVTEARDPLGQVWKTTYDERNRPVTVTDPRPGNKQTSFSFDAFNNTTEITSPSQRTSRLNYDINNSLVSVLDPASETSTNLFDAGGRLAKSTDATGREVSNEYDSYDRLVKTRDQEDNEIVFTYAAESASSKPVGIKFPHFTRNISYNFRGQPVTMTDAFATGSSLTTKYTYYPTGELETVEDAAGRVTRYTIDELGRVTESVSPGADSSLRVSRITYDGAGNVRAFTNPNGQVWSYEYDVARQLTAEITPLGQRTHFTYNALGQLTTIIRADGARIEREFDGIGAVTQVREFTPAGVLAKAVSYTRDDDGRITGYTESLPGVSGGYSSAEYEYDVAGRLKTETVYYAKTDGTAFSTSVSYTYYANGLLQSYTSPSGTVTTYTYDQANRLIGTSVDGVGQFIVNGYDFGAMLGMILPGGISKNFEYDGYQRPTRLTSRDPSGQTVSDITVQRDNIGNIISRKTDQGIATFTYDSANRLIAGQSGSYGYDANGNRRTYSGTGSTQWQYDASDRLISDGTNTYGYDANGSLIRKTTPEGVWTFEYNHDGRLVRVVKPENQVIEYRYDPAGRRIAKIVEGIATHYRYSVFGLCAEYNDQGQLVREYGYSANSGNGAAPLYVKEGARNYFYHTDHLGTPWKLTDEAGNVVWSAVYDDFGMAQISSSLIQSHWRLPGQYFDEETGLHYNYNRYYSPEMGRYITRDPISDGTNFYTYAANNPLTFTDPSGLRTQGDVPSSDGLIDLDKAGNGELAFYLVEWNESQEKWDVRIVDGVYTEHAFVNGIQGDLKRHVELAGKHMPGVKRFTLLNNPTHGALQDILETAGDKLGFTSDPARMLSEELRRIQERGNRVNWTVHSQGGAIFSEAMRHAMAAARAVDNPAPSLSMNSVAFHAGANNRRVTNRIAADAGVTVRGYFYSDYDLVPNVIGANGNLGQVYRSLSAWPLLLAPENIDWLSPHTHPGSIWSWEKQY